MLTSVVEVFSFKKLPFNDIECYRYKNTMPVPTGRVKVSYCNKSIYKGIKNKQNVERQDISLQNTRDRLLMKLTMKKQSLLDKQTEQVEKFN